MSIHKEGSIPLQRPAAADKPGRPRHPGFRPTGSTRVASNPAARPQSRGVVTTGPIRDRPAVRGARRRKPDRKATTSDKYAATTATLRRWFRAYRGPRARTAGLTWRWRRKFTPRSRRKIPSAAGRSRTSSIIRGSSSAIGPSALRWRTPADLRPWCSCCCRSPTIWGRWRRKSPGSISAARDRKSGRRQ